MYRKLVLVISLLPNVIWKVWLVTPHLLVSLRTGIEEVSYPHVPCVPLWPADTHGHLLIYTEVFDDGKLMEICVWLVTSVRSSWWLLQNGRYITQEMLARGLGGWGLGAACWHSHLQEQSTTAWLGFLQSLDHAHIQCPRLQWVSGCGWLVR